MSEVKSKSNETLLVGLKRKATKKVVLLYSAGADSTVAGLELVKAGYKIYPLFIDYNQSAMEAEKYLVSKSPIELGFEPTHFIKTDILSQLTKSALLGKKSIDDDDAWVPGRNTLFMMIAAIYAKQIDADGITIGYMLDDNFVFGDNDYFHHLAIEDIISKSFLQPMKVFMPIKSITKKEVLKILKDKKILESTVTCWNAKIEGGNVSSCHQCANCLERDQYIAELNQDSK